MSSYGGITDKLTNYAWYLYFNKIHYEHKKVVLPPIHITFANTNVSRIRGSICSFLNIEYRVLECIGFTKTELANEPYIEHGFLLILSMHNFFTVFGT
jgi:hypothetical protein